MDKIFHKCFIPSFFKRQHSKSTEITNSVYWENFTPLEVIKSPILDLPVNTQFFLLK